VWSWSPGRGAGSTVLLAFVASCGAPPPATRSGNADSGWTDASAAPRPSAAQLPSAAPPEPWDLEGAIRALHPVTRRARSEHLFGELEGEVLAGPAAGTYPVLGPSSALAPGATLVERLIDPRSAGPVAYFVMVKRAQGYDPAGGDWEYLVMGASGHVETRGKLPLCARCHAEAPHDHLFGGAR
jgi:hypothetical protein